MRARNICTKSFLVEKINNSLKTINKLFFATNVITNNLLTLPEGAAIDLIKSKDGIVNRINELIISTLIQSEITAPGSAKLILKNLLNNKSLNWDENLKLGAEFPNKLDIDWLIKEYNPGIPVKTIKEALNLAGISGRINVTKSESSPTTIIEKKVGYNFPVGSLKKLHGCYKNSRVVIIDGYIENISEISSLFEISHQAKEVLILFHRGLHDEVMNTIIVNWNRGTLKCIPIQVPFDVDGINMLNDIAVVCNSDVISSNKGQLISSIDYQTLPVLNEIKVFDNEISIINPESISNVGMHIKQLLKKRLEVDINLVEIYDKRLRSLTTDLVVIHLQNGSDYRLRRQKLDRFLRAYKCLIDHGTIVIDNQKLLMSTAYAVNKFSKILKNQLESLGAVIELI